MNLRKRLEAIYRKLDPPMTIEESRRQAGLKERIEEARTRTGKRFPSLPCHYDPTASLAENLRRAREAHRQAQDE